MKDLLYMPIFFLVGLWTRCLTSLSLLFSVYKTGGVSTDGRVEHLTVAGTSYPQVYVPQHSLQGVSHPARAPKPWLGQSANLHRLRCWDRSVKRILWAGSCKGYTQGSGRHSGRRNGEQKQGGGDQLSANLGRLLSRWMAASNRGGLLTPGSTTRGSMSPLKQFAKLFQTWIFLGKGARFHQRL